MPSSLPIEISEPIVEQISDVTSLNHLCKATESAGPLFQVAISALEGDPDRKARFP